MGEMRFFWLTLVALGLGTKRHWHILFALVLGIVLGLWFNGPAAAPIIGFFEIVGQIFIRLISMLVIPLVISSLVVGVTSIGDSRELGRMGGKVVGLFILLMIIASVMGAVLAGVFQPGENLHANLRQEFQHVPFADETAALAGGAEVAGSATTAPSGLSADEAATLVKPPSLSELFVDMIPRNPIASLAQMDLVPVIVFAIIFGLAMGLVGEAGRPLILWFDALFATTMKVTDWVMVLAVPGVFALAFVTVATTGPQVLSDFAPYMLVILAGLLLQIVLILPALLKLFANIGALQLYRAISEAIMVAFGTASSSATLPVTIACCERRAGISHRIASFVLPTGASVNKTATTLFEVIAVMFLAQAYGLELAPHIVALIAVFAIVASIGAPGVPSAGLITMAIVIHSIGQNFTPLLGGIAMLWSVDRVLDMCRTAVNVMSSCSVAAIVAASEGELDREMLVDQSRWRSLL